VAQVRPAAPDEAATVAALLYQAAGFSTGEDPGTRDLLMRLPL